MIRDRSSRLTISTEGDVTVVELADRRILDEVCISEIGDNLNSLVKQAPNPKLLIDFSQVAHMSSSALGMLITLHKRIREKGGELRLCCIQPAIYEVFVITRLSEIFSIHQTRPEALDSLK